MRSLFSFPSLLITVLILLWVVLFISAHHNKRNRWSSSNRVHRRRHLNGMPIRDQNFEFNWGLPDFPKSRPMATTSKPIMITTSPSYPSRVNKADDDDKKNRDGDYNYNTYSAPAYHHHQYVEKPHVIDFTPIFLALVPIALFIGASAAFALATAATSSQAVASAQQQQQQEESSNNNNAANNNNALLAAILSINNNNNDHHHRQHPIIIFTNGTNFPYFFNGFGRSAKSLKDKSFKLS